MAKKKGLNKSDFVRSQPSTLSAAEIVAKAKQAGMRISTGLVYVIRSNQRAKGSGKARQRAPAAGRKRAKASGGKGTASDFIRSIPRSVPAAEVVKLGAAQGYSFKYALVYMVRRRMKGKAGGAVRASTKRAAAKRGNRSGHAAEFRALLTRLGLQQMESMYREAHARLSAIGGGE